MSAAGIQPRWKPWACFIFQYFSKRLFGSVLVLNHRVLHFYLEHSMYDDLRGFYVQSVLLCHVSLCVLIFFANCGAFCRLLMQSSKVPACLFFKFYFPAACLRSAALTTAGDVCARACALLWSNNCVWCCCNRVCVLVFRPAVCVCRVALYERWLLRTSVSLWQVVRGCRCCFQVPRLLSVLYPTCVQLRTL